MSKIFIIISAFYAFFSLISPSLSDALRYEGAITTVDGSLVADDNGWSLSHSSNGDNTTLKWEILSPDDLENTTYKGSWRYSYTFSVLKAPAISHVVVEVSNDFSSSNIKYGTTLHHNLDTYPPTNNGNTPFNPPGQIFGLKWEPEEDQTTFSWLIVTDKAPMWGDFYAFGGSAEAWNREFGSIHSNADLFNIYVNPETGERYLDTEYNETDWAFAIVPDTTTTMVPEPATMLLLGFGLMGMAFLGRRRFRK